jgi:hypothetical protein
MKNKLNRILPILALVVLSGTPLFTKSEVAANAALTPPTSYDISFKHDVGYGEYILTGTDSYFGFPAFNREADSTYFSYHWDSSTDLIDGDPLAGILDQHEGLSFSMRFNRSNTNWAVGSGTFAGKYFSITEPIGSDSTVGGVASKYEFSIDNQTSSDYLFYLDVSSTAIAGHGVEISLNGISVYGNSFTFSQSIALINRFYVPAYSTFLLRTPFSTAQRYFNAWYLQNLGDNAAYQAGYDEGEIDGYQEGYDDGYGNSASPLWDGLELVVGVTVNFILFIMTLSIFDISLLSVGIVLISILGIVWVLKAFRG